MKQKWFRVEWDGFRDIDKNNVLMGIRLVTRYAKGFSNIKVYEIDKSVFEWEEEDKRLTNSINVVSIPTQEYIKNLVLENKKLEQRIAYYEQDKGQPPKKIEKLDLQEKIEGVLTGLLNKENPSDRYYKVRGAAAMIMKLLNK